MARYFYDKHTITTSYSYSNRRSLSASGSARINKNSTIHTNYSFSSASGFYGTGANTFWNVYIVGTYDIYLVSNESVYMVTVAVQDGDYFDCNTTGVEECDRTTSYSKGAYIETVIADDGTYPANGMSGGYWYVKGALAFPSLGFCIDEALKTSEMGWARIGNEVREIVSITGRIDGALKEAT